MKDEDMIPKWMVSAGRVVRTHLSNVIYSRTYNVNGGHTAGNNETKIESQKSEWPLFRTGWRPLKLFSLKAFSRALHHVKCLSICTLTWVKRSSRWILECGKLDSNAEVFSGHHEELGIIWIIKWVLVIYFCKRIGLRTGISRKPICKD